MSYIDPRNKVLWHTDRLHELQRGGYTSAPVNVEIDLSNRCSHGCRWCHFAHTHSKGPLAGSDKPAGFEDCGDLMDTDLAMNIVDQLVECGVRSITWTGGGEPTLHPDFDRIVGYAAIAGIQQGLYTHGSHLGRDRAAMLRRTMTFVYVSLDESDKDKFFKAKGVNRFAIVCDGIADLADAPGMATVGVGFLLHPGNYADVPAMVALAKSLGADYCQFRPVIDFDLDNPQIRVNVDWVDNAIRELMPWQADSFVHADIERLLMYRNWQGHGYNRCNWSAMQTVITPNGKVWRCVNRRGHKGAEIGDLTAETFDAVWLKQGYPCGVDVDCRIMCRGHIANLTLEKVCEAPLHPEFI